MKSTIDAKAFASALKKIKGVLRRSSNPELEQVYVEFSEKRCRLTASDLETWMSVELPAKGEAFSFAFSDTNAVTRASAHFKGSLTFDFDEKAHTLRLSCGNKGGTFQTLDAALYPTKPKLEPAQRYQIKVNDLYERVKSVSYAALDREDQPVRSGVRFTDKRVWCVDGYRMAINESAALTVKEPFIVRASSLLHLREFNKCKGELSVEGKYIAVKSKDLTLVCTRLEPTDELQIEHTMPKSYAESYSVDRKQYMEALNYLRDCCRDHVRATVAFDNGVLSLRDNGGNYSVAVTMEGTHEIGYNFRLSYMREALKQFDGEPRVWIKTSSAVSPIIITAGGADTAMVLPVRRMEAAAAHAA